MIARIIRILIVFAAIMLQGFYLPSLYKKKFEERAPKSLLYFSEVRKDFVFSTEVYDSINHKLDMTYSDRQGNSLTEIEYLVSLPFDKVSRLKALGMTPDSVCGAPFTRKVRETTLRVPMMADRGFKYQINPLFESKLNRPGVELPTDLMRITDDGVEFIDAQTNRIDRSKSDVFTTAMLEQGFLFPSTDIFGIPSTIKSRDDGYFIVDKSGKLFNLKMVKGNPLCRKIDNDFKVKNIKCHSTGELSCHIFSTDNELYILKTDYTLKKLPIEPTNGRFMLSLNRYYKSYKNLGKQDNTTYVLDSNFNAVDTCSVPINNYSTSNAAKIEKRIFPFSMMITPGYVYFIPIPNSFKDFIWLNLCLLVVFILLKLYRKRNLLNPFNIVDCLMIGIFGIYGFIAVLVFPNRK